MPIREFVARTDMARVRECLIELQNHERAIDSRMPSGEDIVDAYMPEMLNRCDDCVGKILVAEVDGEIAGYVTILTKVTSEELAAGDFEFGLVSDIVVLQKHRKRGLGRELLDAAETYARTCKVKWLRIGALEGNQAARTLYSSMGFSGLYVELEKDLTGPQ
jgi:GNAT superfamily N-acetyltransferase